MGTLEDDFPECRTIKPTVTYFKLGEEPPAWKQWEHASPAERLRAVELLRRIAYNYDPDTAPVSRVGRFVEYPGG